MRINKFVANASGLSRRAADQAIAEGRILVNGRQPSPGQSIEAADRVSLDGKLLVSSDKQLTIMLNKPIGYVCSRDGQGSQTIYDLLPLEFHHLKPVGRLDKDSSGLLLLTSDGKLAHQLTHPSFQKDKVYEVKLDKPLREADVQKIAQGVELADGLSSLQVKKLATSYKPSATSYQVRMHQGRNRQIRRTFASLGYEVIALHRTQFGPYTLGDTALAKYIIL